MNETSPIMSYGGGEIFGGLFCGPNSKPNWIMIIVILLLIYILYEHRNVILGKNCSRNKYNRTSRCPLIR